MLKVLLSVSLLSLSSAQAMYQDGDDNTISSPSAANPPQQPPVSDDLDYKSMTLASILPPDQMTDEDLTRDEITRAEYEHFYKGTQEAYEVYLAKMKAKLTEEAFKSKCVVNQEGIDKEAARQIFRFTIFQASYDDYKYVIRSIRNTPAWEHEIYRCAQVHQLTVLPPKDIWDIFVNLKTVYMDNNPISDLSPLSGVVNLAHLSMPNTNVTDLSPLSDKTHLKMLNLTDTPNLWHSLHGESIEAAKARIAKNKSIVEALKKKKCNVIGYPHLLDLLRKSVNPTHITRDAEIPFGCWLKWC